MTSSTLKSYVKPSFVICVAVLLTAAVAKEAVIRVLGVQMVKLPVPLQHPLEDMDAAVLVPYELKNSSRIANRDVLESLGTEEYLQWFLEDAEAEPASPTRYCSLFLTYYTGNPDMVPHVPDEFYVGGGNQRASGDTVTIDVPRADGSQKLSFQHVVFKNVDPKLMTTETFSVEYFFHANGDYCSNRTETRLKLGSNWFNKYSYFCKVEWKFYGADSFGLIYPDKDQTLRASQKLMAHLLPELEKKHWPDWEEMK
ncbi:MAG: hypothetical protein ACYS72_05520 [Planctomycetota bacterium]